MTKWKIKTCLMYGLLYCIKKYNYKDFFLGWSLSLFFQVITFSWIRQLVISKNNWTGHFLSNVFLYSNFEIGILNCINYSENIKIFMPDKALESDTSYVWMPSITKHILPYSKPWLTSLIAGNSLCPKSAIVIFRYMSWF